MKTSTIFTFILLLSGSAFAQVKPSTKPQFIGREYHTINEFSQFKGYKENAGSMLEPTEAGFGISQLENKAHNTILVFNKTFEPSQTPKRKLLDTLNIGKPGRSKLVILASCSLNKKKDSEIVALVNDKHTEHYKLVLQAWRANTKTGKFERISTKNIECTAPGFSDEL